nr:Hint domain-containing protein [uncultured Shimia sp.]
MADPTGPGVVEGTENDDVIDSGYSDGDGDSTSGSGDLIYGLGGGDTIEGDGGNDTIHGDSGADLETEREIFKWSNSPSFSDGANAANFTQDTGLAEISFSTVSQSAGVETEYDTAAQNVDDLDADVSNTSSLNSILNGDPNSAHYRWESNAPIENVEFRINDIDGDGRVTVLAYDASGNAIEVQLSDAGSGLSLTDTNSVTGNDTATSVDNNYTSAEADEHSVLVTIAGPVSRWEIVHEQDGGNNTGISVTDIAFDVTEASGLLGGGDDSIFGDDGDDLIFGEGGSDTIDGGEGHDTIYGGFEEEGAVTGRESFNWSEISATGTGTGNTIQDGDDIDPLYTQDTGSVTVTYSEVSNTGTKTKFETDNQNIDDIDGGSETVDDNSSLESKTDNDGEGATYRLDFSDPVANVDFRVNDIDHDSVVQIKAYDMDGNEIPVTLTASAGTDLTLSDEDTVAGDDTASATGNSGPNDGDDNSILVEVAGPVSRIEIIHSNDGGDSSHMNVTDVFFDTLSTGDAVDDSGDSLIGGLGDDVIFGQGGDDTIQGNQGADSIEGGTGNDSIDSSSGSGLLNNSPDLGFPSYMGLPAIPADGDTEDDRDFVDGGAGNDTIVTGDDADTIVGGSGDDSIDAGVDADTIQGGTGDDTIIGGEGNDTIEGGDDDDVIYGGLDPSAPDYLNIPNDGSVGDPDPVTNNGQDLIDGGAGNDIIFGQDDDDTITGGSGNDFIDAGVDNDSVDGGEGIDIITGNQGDDTLSGGDDTDLVLGGTGDDVVMGDAGVDILDGQEGDDTVDGGSETDFIFGEEGDDSLIGGDDSDLIVGGIGNDEIYGDGTTGEGNTAGGAGDLLIGGEGDDTIVGGSGGDVIDGGVGSDTMIGGDDRDTFTEVGVGDVVDGSEGGDDFDTLVISGNALIDYDPLDPSGESGTISFLDLTTMTVTGTATFQNIENVIYVEDLPNHDEFLDEALDDAADVPDVVLVSGSEVLEDDFGGATVGIVDGTAGPDNIDATYVDAEGDRIDPLANGVPGATSNNDTIHGYDGNDSIFGGLGNDEMLGGDGDDIMSGGEGDDVMRGEADNDFLFGGEGADELAGDEGNDTLEGGADNDRLEGGAGDDSLVGGTGNDGLYAGDGNDTLRGGDGQDALSGGAGDDLLDLGGDAGLNIAYGGDDQDTFIGLNDNHTVFGGEGGVDFDTLDVGSAVPPGGSYQVNYTGGNPASESGTVSIFDSGNNLVATINFGQIENVICFTPGTAILTPFGEVAVEDLKEGDRVVTRDNGLQTVRWAGKKRLSGRDLLARPHLRPILIRKGSLGSNVPDRDMMVSPNHRMLLVSREAQLLFQESEVLVAAKHLTHMQGVQQQATTGIEYVHFLCDQHEVVMANGSWSESFQPGEYSMNGIGKAQQNEIYDLFPELRDADGLETYSAARLTLKRHEAKLIG